MNDKTIPGWYIALQAAVLQQLPRLEDITPERAEYWLANQAALKKCLCDSVGRPMTDDERVIFLIKQLRKKGSVDSSNEAFVKIKPPSDVQKSGGAENLYLGYPFPVDELGAYLRGQGKVMENPYTFLRYILNNPECADNGKILVYFGENCFVSVQSDKNKKLAIGIHPSSKEYTDVGYIRVRSLG